MSYSRGLGAAAAPSASAIATMAPPMFVTTAPSDSLIPSHCHQVWRERYEAPPATVPAGRPYVAAFPLFKFSGSESIAQKYLDLFLLEPTARSPGMPAGLAFGPALLRWTDKYAPVGPNHPVEGRLQLTYFAVGWIPEKERTTQTRGVFWVAFAFDASVATSRMQQYAQRILWAAEDLGAGRVGGRGATLDPIEAAALTRMSTGLSGITVQMGHSQAVAAGTSNDAILSAVYNSALGLAQFGSGLRVFFQLADGRREVSRINGQVQAAARSTQEAYALYQGLDQVVSAVDGAIGTALATEPATAGETILNNSIAVVRTARTKLEEGLTAAPGVLRLARDLETGLKPAVKATIQRAADAVAARSEAVAFSLMKEYTYCAAYKQADATYQQVKRELDTALASATLPAQTLITDREKVVRAIVKLQGLAEKLEAAKGQLGLDWWERTKAGLPVWGWMAGGAAVLLGGAVVVRLKKKRSPTPNRRRRRSR